MTFLPFSFVARHELISPLFNKFISRKVAHIKQHILNRDSSLGIAAG
jgi:hypothetical protein